MGSVGVTINSLSASYGRDSSSIHTSYNVRPMLEHSMPTERHLSPANKYTIGKNLTSDPTWANSMTRDILKNSKKVFASSMIYFYI